MRPQRTRTTKPRRRLNGSSRRKTRSAILRRQADQWGETFNEHGRALTSSYICNLEKDFALYTEKKATKKTKQELLSLSFKELYTRDQLRLTYYGPLSLYSPEHILLFIRACADARLCKTSTSSTSLPPCARFYLRTFANSEPSPPFARISSICTYHSYRGMY